jgi:hypothetical protein
MICNRCGKDAQAFTGSYFNMETICLDCRDREEAHPDFQRAREVESAAVLNGNFNFPGIGLPDDLKEKP